MPGPVAILFDLGNTVLREHHYDLAAGVRALLCADDVATRRSAAEAEAATQELQAEIDRVHRTHTAEFTLADWLDRELREPTADARADAERRLWQHVARLQPMPGAREGLRTLSEDGARLGVVSNAVFTSGTLAWELERHALRQPFAFVLSSADLRVRKPDAAIFSHALERLGASAGETWFVGDSFANDVAGAHAAGLHALWLSADGSPGPDVPHRRVRDWEELMALYRGGCFR